jgi:phage gp36-like protein
MTTITTFLSAADLAACIPAGELIQLLDDPTAPTGALNTTLRDQLLARAQGRMESKIAVKYALPLVVEEAEASRVQETLRSYALAIFRWLAVADKPHADEAFKGIQTNFKDAVAWLDDVAAGKAMLGTSKPLASSQARGSGAQSAAHDGTFNRERLRGW